MRVLVCGGRNWDREDIIYDVLDKIHAKEVIGCIIQGGARGADQFADMWAERNGVCGIEIRANWTAHGAGAGPIRNAWMLKYGLPDLVIAFPTPESKGTWDMIKRAEKKKIPTSVWEK